MGAFKNRSKKSPFLLVEIRMLRDESFYQGLSAKAQLLFIYLRAAYNPYEQDSVNLANGKTQIKLSYSQISKISGFHSYQTINRTIKELIDKGWVELTECGGKFGGANAYSFPNEYGPFKNDPKNKKSKQKKFA